MWMRALVWRGQRGLERCIGGALAVVLVLAAAGCAEKIAGPDAATRATVTIDLKSVLAGMLRLTVTGPDMEPMMSLIETSGEPVFAKLSIPLGLDRQFVVEAFDGQGTLIYRGQTTVDVISLLPLALTIPVTPVVPLVYLIPHEAETVLGEEFTVTINVHELTGLREAVMFIHLFGDEVYEIGESVVIESVELAPSQVARGSSLTYENYALGYLDVTVSNEGPLVDEDGDGALVIIRCRTQDTWPGSPLEFVPTLGLEVLDGYLLPIGDVYIDTAHYRFVRGRVPESFLGSEFDDTGVALVGLGGGQVMLAAVWSANADMTPPLYLARLGSATTPLSETWTNWNDGQEANGLAPAVGGGWFVSRVNSFRSGSIARIDESGAEVWFEDLRDVNSGEPRAVASRPGGGCVTAGTWSNDGMHFYLAAFDAAGYVGHYAPTDFSRNQEFLGVVALDDTTFVATGYEQPFDGPGNAVLAKYTLAGEFSEQWVVSHDDGGDETAFDLVALADGGFMLVGAVAGLEGGLRNMYVVRTDRDGKEIWTRRFGSGDYDEIGYCVAGAPDGTFVAAGSVSEQGRNRDVYVVKFDGSGNLIWENSLGGTGDDIARDIVAVSGGYLLTGFTNPGRLGGRDILVLRLGSDGKRSAD